MASDGPVHPKEVLMASKSTGGWSAMIRKENLPFVVALQGLAFFLLAFLLGTPPPHHDSEDASTAGWLRDAQSPQLVSDSQVPTDLIPEQLRLPRFPEPEERTLERQPAAAEEDSEVTAGATSTLNALRIDTISYSTPTMVQVALALPDAPDEIAPGMISDRRFGEGTGRPGRKGRRGWGEGIGGIGIGDMGDGPRCHPRRPGFLENPRNPITGPPAVIGY